MKIDSQLVIDAVMSSKTMAEAAAKTNLHYNTFISYAKLLGVHRPNQGGKGPLKAKTEGKGKIPLSEILDGHHPGYQTFKLKKRLYENGIKHNKCEICETSSWCEETLECELDHIDGNSNNHRLENLRVLCPNCHSQTTTFRAKNKRQ